MSIRQKTGRLLVLICLFVAVSLLLQYPHRAYAVEVGDDARNCVAEMMAARGMGEPFDCDMLLDGDGEPCFVIGISEEGYLIADSIAGIFLEQGGGVGPYSEHAEIKYYGGFGCYAEERDGVLVDVLSGRAIDEVPYSPAAEAYVSERRAANGAESPDSNDESDGSGFFELKTAQRKIRDVAFGLNSSDANNDDAINNTCTAIAMSIALNYLDYTLDGRLVQTSMELEDRIPDSEGNEHYPHATAFHRHLVEDCLLDPENELGISTGVFGEAVRSGFDAYLRAHLDREAVGLSLEWFLLDDGWIEESIDRDFPALITTTLVEQSEYNFHTMVAYGYRKVDGVTTEINLHSGWRNSSVTEDPDTGLLSIKDIWLPMSTATITYIFNVADGLHHSGSGRYRYYENNVPVKSAWRTIDGYGYYFDASGVRATGWRTIDGSRYHFDTNGVRTTGHYAEGGIRYHFNSDGVLVSQSPISSPFTGPGDDFSPSNLQVAAQQRIQAKRPDAIPDALARAMTVNPDVFAWLYVPGTDVSVPVARHEGDGSYYLHHDSFGNESSIGCAYTQQGAGDLSDAVTVLYGHSFSDVGLAFTSLHEFEDYAFFAGHEKVYLYLHDKRLEYRVVGANLFNARAIEEVDQTDAADLGDYFAELSNPDPDAFMGLKRRFSLDAGRDRVLQLSTCTVPADPAHRFVVTCMLEGEREL